MSRSHRSLSVICPCYNEADVIKTFYERTQSVLDDLPDINWRILFIDDDSNDKSLDVLNEMAQQDERVRVYSFSRNFGHQIALTAGLDVATGDAVIMMDSDLQHPPELIPQMVDLWQQGYDVVSAVRQNTQDATIFKKGTSRIFYWMMNLVSDTPIVAGAADFCLLSSRAHQALKRMPERHRFLRGMVSWIGFKRVMLPYDAPSRAAGYSKYTIRKMIRLGADAVCSFSAKPLRIGIRVGLLLVAAGFSYFAYVVGRYVWIGDLVPGWASLISVTVVLGGMQLAMMGLLGEYVARVFEQTKARPLYLFKQGQAEDDRDGTCNG